MLSEKRKPFAHQTFRRCLNPTEIITLRRLVHSNEQIVTSLAWRVRLDTTQGVAAGGHQALAALEKGRVKHDQHPRHSCSD
jgi:hypothetical protein